MLSKWGKNEFQKFLPGTIFQIKKRDYCRWRVPVRYCTYPKFRINRITGLEIVRGGTKFHTHTHKHTHTHTHPEAYFISLVFLRKVKKRAGDIQK